MRFKNFPILYGQDTVKRIKTWEIRVIEDNNSSIIVTRHGLESGKKIETERLVTEGKNIGKVNETSVYEQALQEATSKWKKKKTQDQYTENLLDLDGNDSEFKSVPIPMSAHDFSKQKMKISYPCFTQPKLDGYRAVFYKNKLYSRSGLEHNSDSVRHILDELKDISWILDGELYISNENFNGLGIVRKKKLSEVDIESCKEIKYCVYDVVDRNIKYSERKELLEKLFSEHSFKYVKNVSTSVARNETEILEHHKQNVLNYEGTMIRNGHSLYETSKRSYNLQKYKDWMDSEFEIVDFTKEQGDLVLWWCVTSEGKRFKVTSIGTRAERKRMYKEATKYIGKQLWVKFMQYTPDGIPRIPKSMRSGEDSIRNEKI